MKRVLALILAIIMLSACFCFNASAADASFLNYEAKGVKTCTDPSGIFNYVLCDGHESAPIRIIPATLKQDGKTTRIYLIGLVGVETQKGQVNVFKNTIPSAFNETNPYTELIIKTVKEKIPAGSKIVFAGHSLGGMVAQQVIADPELTDNYDILYTITAGSPYIMVKGEREGELNRLADKYDAVPFLSPATFVSPIKQFGQRHTEDGGYFFNPDGAHNLSYRRTEIWDGYDAVGVKDGNATITFNFANIILVGRVEQ